MDDSENEEEVLKVWESSFKYRQKNLYPTIKANQIFDNFKCLKAVFAPKLVTFIYFIKNIIFFKEFIKTINILFFRLSQILSNYLTKKVRCLKTLPTTGEL